MPFTVLNHGAAPRRFTILVASAALIALTLAGCADDSSDDSGSAGTAFTQALAKNYTDLANQANGLPAPQSDDGFFDSLNPLNWFSGNPNDDLATAFTDKADTATGGQEPDPEAAPPDAAGQDIRARLVSGIAAGKDQFPAQAAAAQADYDCWVMAGAVPSAAPMAQACRSSLASALVALESSVRPAPPPVAPVTSQPIPAPAPAPAAATNTTDFTAYFDFDSWTLTAEDLKTITDVINSARTGGQTHITVVGHTDTSGTVEYNQKLSVRRANVVVEALVDLGARRAAIKASGVGKTDLAVQTGDGVKEAKNRRTVIDLLP